ncbi:MAG: hypothetical protein JRD19_02060 [Deltaproteobacteria bacterium]|jgi:hypothetical protein|nr:hypothetical protein [Deltaproteobacteria bacterium]
MKRTLMPIGLLIGMFAATILVGCAAKYMNGSMDSSIDNMSEENVDSGMRSMQGEEMRNVGTGDMEKTMK